MRTRAFAKAAKQAAMESDHHTLVRFKVGVLVALPNDRDVFITDCDIPVTF